MTSDDQRLNTGIQNLLAEYSRSVQIHTDWRDYDESRCYDAVEDEFLEFRRAVVAGDLDSHHGIVNESLQLAVVALKAHLYFSQKKG
jgi:hypothetical protein